MLDALAGADRQLAGGSEAGPGGVHRRGAGHRRERAGYRRRIRRTISERPGAAVAQGARGRSHQQRLMDARLRTDFRDRRPGQAARRRLDLQRLGRPRRRFVLSLGPRRRSRAESARDRRGRSIPHAVRPRRRRDPRRWAGYLSHDRGMSLESQSQSGSGAGGHRGGAAPLSRRHYRDLARCRCLPGRNRRPYRRARVLHEPRSRRADLDRRPQGPSIRDLAGCLPALEAAPAMRADARSPSTRFISRDPCS